MNLLVGSQQTLGNNNKMTSKLGQTIASLMPFLELKDIAKLINLNSELRRKFTKTHLIRLFEGSEETQGVKSQLFSFGTQIKQLTPSELVILVQQLDTSKQPVGSLNSKILEVWDYSSFDFDQHPSILYPDVDKTPGFWSTKGWTVASEAREWLTYAVKGKDLVLPRELRIDFYRQETYGENQNPAFICYPCEKVIVEYFYAPPISPKYPGPSTAAGEGVRSIPFYQEEHSIPAENQGIVRLRLSVQQPAKFLRIHFQRFPTPQDVDHKYYMAIRKVAFSGNTVPCQNHTPLYKMIAGRQEKGANFDRLHTTELESLASALCANAGPNDWSESGQKHPVLLDRTGLAYIREHGLQPILPPEEGRFGSLSPVHTHQRLKDNIATAFAALQEVLLQEGLNKGVWMQLADQRSTQILDTLTVAVTQVYDAILYLGIEYLTVTPELIPKAFTDAQPVFIREAIKHRVNTFSYPLICRKLFFVTFFRMVFLQVVAAKYQSLP